MLCSYATFRSPASAPSSEAARGVGARPNFSRPAVRRNAPNAHPAPGVRDAGSQVGGVLYAVGNSGYSWSSAIPTAADVGHRAYYLDFYYDGIYPNTTTNRAFGFPLRCLQE